MANTEQVTALKLRVATAMGELKYMGAIKSAKYYFAKKYPQYSQDDDRLNNLWYSKSTDENLTKCIETFVIFKKTEFA